MTRPARAGQVPAAGLPCSAEGDFSSSRTATDGAAAGGPVVRRRGEQNRLGFALQLTTVRFLGTFLADPLDVPWVVVEYLSRQLDIADPSVVKAYSERPATQWEHTAEVRRVSSLVDFADAELRLREFLAARAWTRAERPSALFDEAVAWLRAGRVLLPGVSVLARLVAEVRADETTRLHEALAGQVDVALQSRLDGLLMVPGGERFSELDRLRRAPTRASGREMARALDRAAAPPWRTRRDPVDAPGCDGPKRPTGTGRVPQLPVMVCMTENGAPHGVFDQLGEAALLRDNHTDIPPVTGHADPRRVAHGYVVGARGLPHRSLRQWASVVGGLRSADQVRRGHRARGSGRLGTHVHRHAAVVTGG